MNLRHTWLGIAAVGLVALACGGPEGDEPDEYASQESEARSSFDYDCHQTGGGSGTAHLHLTSTKLRLSTRRDFGDGLEGWYDASYRNAGARVRYQSSTQEANPFDDPRAILVTSEMRTTGGITLNTGGKGGFLTLQYGGDAYGATSYLCRRATGLPAMKAHPDNTAWQLAHQPPPPPPQKTPPNKHGDKPDPAPAPPPQEPAGPMMVEGAEMSAAEAASVVNLAGTGAFADLKSAGLTTTQANAILAGRPYPTVAKVASVPGIGTASLIKMRDWAPAHGF